MRLSQLLPPRSTKHDMVLPGGTRFETAAKAGRNWNDGTVETLPPSGSSEHTFVYSIFPYFGAMVTLWLQLINEPLPYSRGDSEYNLDVNVDTILDVFWKCPE